MEVFRCVTFIVPVIIMTYYAVIGGWILKYIAIYILGSGKEAVASTIVLLTLLHHLHQFGTVLYLCF